MRVYRRQLSGCRADGNDHFGFLIIDTPSVLLNSCNVAENGHGIFLSGAEKCTLMNNSMEGNRYNFGIYGGDEREFIHSIDTSNTVDGKPVYYLLNATGNPEGGISPMPEQYMHPTVSDSTSMT
ncbi:right-handed parallel beta-helix repeat-containing protein [Methanogenium cariaci]|uniref:right-handed parallel beta-helix repeat-containing protein n=1 Tax=Methanogenium cariaci TaxID=2197 RepID=UPI0009FB0F8E|nr:right-handed parallel beta-helix repeat-containing protein [Methanogenium cariaci]